MDLQKYLNEIIEEAKEFLENTENLRQEYPEFFNNYEGKNLSSMSDEKLKEFYKTSQVLNDTQILFTKVASLIYFSKKTNQDLDISKLSNVKGLSEFVSTYEPFQTDYIKTSEKLEQRNIDEDNKKFQEFKRSIKIMVENNLIPDEPRE